MKNKIITLIIGCCYLVPLSASTSITPVNRFQFILQDIVLIIMVLVFIVAVNATMNVFSIVLNNREKEIKDKHL